MPRPSRSQVLSRFPWWLLAIALLGLVTLWAIVADEGYAEIFDTLRKGVVTTLWVTLVSFALASVLGLVSFVAFIALLVLYVLRAVEIRRLRRDAPFLADKNGRPK